MINNDPEKTREKIVQAKKIMEASKTLQGQMESHLETLKHGSGVATRRLRGG